MGNAWPNGGGGGGNPHIILNKRAIMGGSGICS